MEDLLYICSSGLQLYSFSFGKPTHSIRKSSKRVLASKRLNCAFQYRTRLQVSISVSFLHCTCTSPD